jgi:hypothetical protein
MTRRHAALTAVAALTVVAALTTSGARAAPAARPAVDDYALRQALIAWDMLSKAGTICPRLGKETARLDDIQNVAQARLHVSAKALHITLAREDPPLLMTANQAAAVVANAGGCNAPALAQWQGSARWVTDTSLQVIAGEAPANLAWPAQAALEKPLRITVLGQQRDMANALTVQLLLANEGPAPARVALLASQLFVGLCTQVGSRDVPITAGYVPTQWLTIPPRFKAPITLVLGASCKPQPRVNVGGAIAVDMGQGVRYRRFLLRGVGQAPTQRVTIPASEPPPFSTAPATPTSTTAPKNTPENAPANTPESGPAFTSTRVTIPVTIPSSSAQPASSSEKSASPSTAVSSSPPSAPTYNGLRERPVAAPVQR